MKLIFLLVIVGSSYAAKLDRTYLPPPGAETAGGSPGSLTAPIGFQSPGSSLETRGQAKPSFNVKSEPTSNQNNAQPPITSSFSRPQGAPTPSFNNQEYSTRQESSLPSFNTQNSASRQGSPVPSFNNQDSASQRGSSVPSFNTQNSASRQGSPVPSFNNQDSASQRGSSVPSFNTQNSASRQGSPVPSFNNQGDASPQETAGNDNQRERSGPSSSVTGQGSAQEYVSDFRPQDKEQTDINGLQNQDVNAASNFGAADNRQSNDAAAEILRYDNQIDGDSFAYSFETSNGIAAEENGVATNGVQAQGGFSYTGDDGQFYSVTYTADENGYLPLGDHLPTSPPIPDAILRSIEENEKAAAAGTQEGAYNEEENYESNSQPQYGVSSDGANGQDTQSAGINQQTSEPSRQYNANTDEVDDSSINQNKQQGQAQSANSVRPNPQNFQSRPEFNGVSSGNQQNVLSKQQTPGSLSSSVNSEQRVQPSNKFRGEVSSGYQYNRPATFQNAERQTTSNQYQDPISQQTGQGIQSPKYNQQQVQKPQLTTSTTQNTKYGSPSAPVEDGQIYNQQQVQSTKTVGTAPRRQYDTSKAPISRGQQQIQKQGQSSQNNAPTAPRRPNDNSNSPNTQGQQYYQQQAVDSQSSAPTAPRRQYDTSKPSNTQGQRYNQQQVQSPQYKAPTSQTSNQDQRYNQQQVQSPQYKAPTSQTSNQGQRYNQQQVQRPQYKAPTSQTSNQDQRYNQQQVQSSQTGIPTVPRRQFDTSKAPIRQSQQQNQQQVQSSQNSATTAPRRQYDDTKTPTQGQQYYQQQAVRSQNNAPMAPRNQYDTSLTPSTQGYQYNPPQVKGISYNSPSAQNVPTNTFQNQRQQSSSQVQTNPQSSRSSPQKPGDSQQYRPAVSTQQRPTFERNSYNKDNNRGSSSTGNYKPAGGQVKEQYSGAPYQYSPPSTAAAASQGNAPTGLSGSKGEQFGGPRQPPSFSPEEGYKY